jgi:hypothetical protein
VTIAISAFAADIAAMRAAAVLCCVAASTPFCAVACDGGGGGGVSLPPGNHFVGTWWCSNDETLNFTTPANQPSVTTSVMSLITITSPTSGELTVTSAGTGAACALDFSAPGGENGSLADGQSCKVGALSLAYMGGTASATSTGFTANLQFHFSGMVSSGSLAGAGTVATTCAPVDHGAESNTFPAPHPAPPQVLDHGGPILANPRVIPITFAGDSAASDLEAYAAAIGHGSYWSAVVNEYGVHAVTSGTPIRLTQPAPPSIDDATIRTLIQQNLEGVAPAWGAPDKSAVYTLFFPASTAITYGTDVACKTVGGYHEQLALADGTPIAYVVIPRCSTLPIPGMLPTGIDLATGATSHEWIEASTDPYWHASPGYLGIDTAHLSWGVFPGGELADQCEYNPGAFFLPTGLAHDAARSWSNSAAAGGHDPCVPHVSAQPYFNSAPVLKDDITFSVDNTVVPGSKGVKIPVGGSGAVEVDLFSDGPTNGPWIVTAMDRRAFLGQPPLLQFAFDRPSGTNGEKLYLTITVLAQDQYAAEPFVIISKLGDESNLWYGMVGN